MKSEMRDVLARQSFEEKIRKVGELIRLAKTCGRSDAISERLDPVSAQLDAGEGAPMKVREEIGRCAAGRKIQRNDGTKSE